MTDLFDLPDADICQPEWLSEFVQNEFTDFLYHYDDEMDFTDYIYPIEADGVTDYFFGSQIYQILHIQTRHEIQNIVDYLRSIDLLQREYLPSKHFNGLQFLVSSFNLIFTLFLFSVRLESDSWSDH